MKRAAKAIWCDLMPSSPVFTTAQVAGIAGMAPSNASRDLAKLEAEGLLTHVRRGLWAIPTHPEFSAHAVVPHLFADVHDGYVSATSALRLHGMIEETPRAVQVMTTAQRPLLRTPVATYEFHRIQEALFGGFGPWPGTGSFDLAGPEKALFDALYLSTRKNRRFARLPRITVADGFAPERLEEWISKVEHVPLRRAIARRWDDVRERAAR
jgi:hypothetical protein